MIQQIPKNFLWATAGLIVLIVLWKTVTSQIKWLVRILYIAAAAAAYWFYFLR
jgi:hypothetical protein